MQHDKSPPGFRPITAVEVEKMLRVARAPEPWAFEALHPTVGRTTCATLAADLNELMAELPEQRRAAALAAPVMESLAALRRALPALTVYHEAESLHRGSAPSALHALAAAAERVRQECDEAPAAKRNTPTTAEWNWVANATYTEYCLLVGRAAPTENGPAVRFILAMLKRLNFRAPTEVAIRQALRRVGLRRYPPPPPDLEPMSPQLLAELKAKLEALGKPGSTP